MIGGSGEYIEFTYARAIGNARNRARGVSISSARLGISSFLYGCLTYARAPVTRTHTHTCTPTRPHVRMHTHACIRDARPPVRMHARSHMYACLPVCMHTHTTHVRTHVTHDARTGLPTCHAALIRHESRTLGRGIITLMCCYARKTMLPVKRP